MANHRAGATWNRLAKKGPEHFALPGSGAQRLDLHDVDRRGPGAGLWLSKDDGQTWTPMSLPFANAQRVTFDPADENVIYVSTFGGSVARPGV